MLLRYGRRALVCAAAGAVVGCGSGSVDPEPQPDAPPPPTRNLPEQIVVAAFLDSITTLMPGRDSDGYRPPTATERAAMVALMERARSGDPRGADSLAWVYRYDVEPTVDATTGDTLIVVVERAPVRRGWGTLLYNLHGVAVDVHVNHPLYDLETPRVAAALYAACRCRALLMAGTHRYANADDVSDMARSTTSVFQGLHERLGLDAVMAISIHGFAGSNHQPPTATSDAVLSNGATSSGALAATAGAQNLRDRLAAAGFVAGLVADDAGYTELTGSVNPQGTWSNDRFGHGRWIHAEIEYRVRRDGGRWPEFATKLAEWAVLQTESSTPAP
jgi:hypothetical protein